MGFYHDHCVYLPAMLGWFFFSAAISSYNKYVFGASHMAFPCPLLLTSIHFLVQWTVSFAVTAAYPEVLGGDQVKGMTWKKFLGVSIPCGLVTSGDVGLSNLALVRISITFYTMVKASAPIFVVASAFVFGIERITVSLIVVVFIIAAGEFLTVLGEVNFDTIGFVLCLCASVLSGMRWTIVQLKIQRLDPPLKSTLATMRILSPVMFISMFLLSMVLERPWVKLGPGSGTNYFASVNDGLFTLSLGLGGAFLAIAMVLCEFYLIMKSNAIVLMIGGVVKEMITILMGVLAFGDILNAVNIAGFCVVFLGVVTYKVTFHMNKMERAAAAEGERRKRVRYRQVTGEQQGNDGQLDEFREDGEEEDGGSAMDYLEGLDDLDLTEEEEAGIVPDRQQGCMDETEPVEPGSTIV
eukprot:CAMPEP_0197435760 /NCGR_PEP_ID=MMETSP1175-20131217/3293_1 /TAXON_ID=1003142 /ORGANISM="Triceratium dubium, Strain CCMP147" /LENGTH=409 /DNA_ID=CAMNT_0042964875 /DNA_START=104 /DNA_END=1333 /DNA_ORIENTATION=-